MAKSDDYQTFPADVRTHILDNDNHRCQICGQFGPERGGHIDLEAHHIEENPTGMDRDHPENGTTLCIPCHHLVTNRPTAADLPFDLDTVAAEIQLLYRDIEILMYVYENGPATTGDIQNATSCTTRARTIERLWTLMSVDRDVESLDRPLIDKDADTGDWGTPAMVETTVRGRLPEDRVELINRLIDELLRRLLAVDVPRSELCELFDCSLRATFYMEKRAGALRVPISDDSDPNALIDEDEFDQLVAGLGHLLGGVDDVQNIQ